MLDRSERRGHSASAKAQDPFVRPLGARWEGGHSIVPPHRQIRLDSTARSGVGRWAQRLRIDTYVRLALPICCLLRHIREVAAREGGGKV
ncbi:hypothetical protein AJ80_00445 [Polytolypa hystricis UAMH7299]|uniref:Uncharacterized protein n=1 Tax=Polytolypa hystricis (strain UAMH7299) TaxID=1447883 RepID=A0A2B7Z2Q4_POLH7|nr:hypothetical protein AJ80_00445 [Polytolypa hystricis UAMH7299]